MNKYEDILMAFGRAVRDMRIKKGLSQEELALRCGIDRTYISGVERGKRNICLKNIVLVASHLDVETSKLFEGISEHAK